MMLRGEHRNEEGLQSIVNLRASLKPPIFLIKKIGGGGPGLSEVLKVAFPDTVPVARPKQEYFIFPILSEWPDLLQVRDVSLLK